MPQLNVQALLAALQHLSAAAQHVLLIGPVAGGMARFIRARASVQRVELLVDHAAPVTPALDSPYDTAMLTSSDVAALDSDVLAGLAPAAFIYIVSWSQAEHDIALQQLIALGLVPYRVEALAADDAPVLTLLVKRGYDPVAHAQRLRDAGRFEAAYDVLKRIPPQLLNDDATAAEIEAERLLTLLVSMRQPQADALLHFSRAQQHFFEVIARAPHHIPANLCMAEIWRSVGDSRRGRMLLESQLSMLRAGLTGHPLDAIPVVEQQLRTFPRERRVETDPLSSAAPLAAKKPRILYLIHPRMHYGLDILYDGLHQILGPEKLIEYPYKPTLHGEKPLHLKNYPCAFDLPAQHWPLEEITQQLAQGHFDFILYGDVEGTLPPDALAAILAAAHDLPIAVYDALDEPLMLRAEIEERLGRPVQAYFKREMLNCHEYDEDVFPLPFAFPINRVPQSSAAPRELPFFWAGHRQFGMRRLYLEPIERLLGTDLRRALEPEQYAMQMMQARTGLNLAGAGFDTVRYWELPAHQVMMISEHLPIRIPHNFKHGVSAVFFETVEELLELLSHYIQNPDEAAAIARNGREHFLLHHTTTARASQFLTALPF